jgi:hypothetical protein
MKSYGMFAMRVGMFKTVCNMEKMLLCYKSGLEESILPYIGIYMYFGEYPFIL